MTLVIAIIDPGNRSCKYEILSPGPLYRDQADSAHPSQTTLTPTGLSAHFKKAKELHTQNSAKLQAWSQTAAEQLKTTAVWHNVNASPTDFYSRQSSQFHS